MEASPQISAVNDQSVSQLVFTITEKAPTMALSWLKAASNAFTFKNLFYSDIMMLNRHPNMVSRHKIGTLAQIIFANQPIHPL